MRSYVITGGTDGIGRGLGLRLLDRGDRVIAVASGAVKGEAFLAAADGLGATGRAYFVCADLSTLAGMRAAATEITAHTGTLDGLVLATQRFRPHREITPDGFEYTFALSYLSRYVLGRTSIPALEQAATPVILNICGSGGLPGAIHWDDPTLGAGYTGIRAAVQASRCNDLLGVAHPRCHPRARTRYLLFNPMFVRTAMADPLPPVARAVTKALAAVFARPVERAVEPLLALLDNPPSEPITAFRRTKEIPLRGANFDPARADRLTALTEKLLAGRIAL
ncbi:SDR family NAD(P)-dependent oxidoreductase [Nocardia sp. NPDC001965]